MDLATWKTKLLWAQQNLMSTETALGDLRKRLVRTRELRDRNLRYRRELADHLREAPQLKQHIEAEQAERMRELAGLDATCASTSESLNKLHDLFWIQKREVAELEEWIRRLGGAGS